MNYVDIIFIAVVGKFQAYSANDLCLYGQSLSCFQSDCGGSELDSTKMRSLLMFAVAEFSTTNRISYIYHEKGS